MDKTPETKDISLGTLVIAVHKPSMPEWYRTGKVEKIGSNRRKFKVKFDNGDDCWVQQSQIRLVKRPEFC